ncbi:hypothetical protein cce_4260 [Crocosphaera subtropica ATCC 51142]|uniref:Uncharacterized protein n=1 Tax=Crocosphaera subtropica (strain ATCC 51142 / BH68) TaxID=43989 RepID=B1WSM9_CROS5|nr:hypothetical protein [Crocosphaera subtropica]ACB53608.1 hypothetical protein cce_4260 [Crocosphaera subtropica ATCC 51142]
MLNSSLSPAQAKIDLTLWQVEADSISSNELYVWLVDSGLPSDVACRLHELISFTKRVGNKIFNIGKIVLIKIIDFVKAHPFLVAGMGIGAVIGQAIATLIVPIPFLGQLLAPIAAVLGITITLTGAVIGNRLDKRFSGVGDDKESSLMELLQLIDAVKNGQLSVTEAYKLVENLLKKTD